MPSSEGVLMTLRAERRYQLLFLDAEPLGDDEDRLEAQLLSRDRQPDPVLPPSAR